MNLKIEVTKFVVLTVVMLTQASASYGTTEEMVKKIVALRGEVESKSRELDILQKQWQSKFETSLQKRNALDELLNKEKLREIQIKEKESNLQSEVKSQFKSDPKGIQYLTKYLKSYETWIQNSPPFEKDERSAELVSIRERLASGKETVEGLLSELFLLFERDLKRGLTNDYQIKHSATNSLQHEAVRLGWYSYLVRSENKFFSYKQLNEDWKLVELSDQNLVSSLNTLFLDMKENRNSGVYQIPQSL